MAGEVQQLARSYLELADKLRACLTGLEKDVPIPQIAVVGDQSSGKSSVLEAISGVAFPRGSGLVTRCATEVRMKSAEKWAAHAFTTANPHSVVALPSGAAIESAITRMTDELCGTKGGFSKECIVVVVQGPELPDLTIIDLPGIVHTATAEQSNTVVEQVHALVRSYMKQPRTINLIVVPSNQNVATVSALEMAHEYDQDGVRTMGVLTKPDLVDKGAERDPIAVLLNDTKPLKLGYVMVKNRSQSDIAAGTTLAAARAAEAAYFASNPAFAGLDPSLFTVANLRARLSALLVSRIRTELPAIRKEVDAQLAPARAELAALGIGLDSLAPEKKAQYLAEQVGAFAASVAASANGRYSNAGHHADGGAAGVAAAPADAAARGERMYRDAYHAMLVFKRAVDATQPQETDAHVKEVAAGMRDFKGEELPVFPSFGFFCGRTAATVGAWRAPAEALVQGVRVVLEEGAAALAAAHMERLPALREDVVTIAMEVVEHHTQQAMAAIRELWQDEHTLSFTLDDRFVEMVSAKRVQRGKSGLTLPTISPYSSHSGTQCAHLANTQAALNAWVEQHMGSLKLGTNSSNTAGARDMLDLLAAYWHIAARRFTDAVGRAVVRRMLTGASATLATRMAAVPCDAAAVERVLAEDPLVRSRRAALARRVKRLTEAKAVLAGCMAP